MKALKHVLHILASSAEVMRAAVKCVVVDTSPQVGVVTEALVVMILRHDR